MDNIGRKIRELRKKNDLTQENLADFLHVSCQAVSKWECGVSSPDLALIGPLTKLLHVTADELLGLTMPEVDARRAELDERCRQAWLNGGGEADGFRGVYDAMEVLVREYPDDLKTLCEFAWITSNRAWNFEDSAVFREEQERAAGYFTTVLEHTEEDSVKQNAIEGIVRVYGYLGETERAKAYIGLLPETPTVTRELLTETLLRGEDLRKFRQERLRGYLTKLIHLLPLCTADELRAVMWAEEVLDGFFPDGDDTEFHVLRGYLLNKKALRLLAAGDANGAVAALREYRRHMVLADAEERAGARHTSPYFDLLTVDACRDGDFGCPSYTEAFGIDMTEAVFDPLREREDFRELCEK